MTGKTKVWPVKSRISPDIVRWPAVISSPVYMYLQCDTYIIYITLDLPQVDLMNFSVEYD